MTDEPVSLEEAERLRRQASNAAVAVSVVLSAAKLVAWLLTGSVALLSSLVDSVLDVAAAVLTLVTVRHAMRPPDKGHRYGHGKFEALGALAQMAFIAGSGLLIIFQAIDRLIAPEPIEATPVGLGVMGLSITLTLGLVVFQRHAVRRTGSVGIDAISLNYRGDVLMNLSVIAALAAYQWTGEARIDPIAAIAIAGYMLWNAFSIGRESIDVLMDRELSVDDRRRIVALVMADNRAQGVHDLRTRSAGMTQFIELHLELEGELTLSDAHDVCDDIEAVLKGAFPGAEVILHQEPAGLDDERLDARIRQATLAEGTAAKRPTPNLNGP